MKVTILGTLITFLTLDLVGCDQSPRVAPDRGRVDFGSTSGNTSAPPYNPGSANAVPPTGACNSLEACPKLALQVQIGGAGRQVSQRSDQVYWYAITSQVVQWEFTVTGAPAGRELFAYPGFSGPQILPISQKPNQFKIRWIPQQSGTHELKFYVRDVARCELNAAKSNGNNDCRTSKSSSYSPGDFEFTVATVLQDIRPVQNRDGTWSCVANTLANVLGNVGGTVGDIFSGISNSGSTYGSGYLGGSYLGGYNGGCNANGFNLMPYQQQNNQQQNNQPQ